MAYLLQKGYHIPQEIAIAGFDDMPLAAYMPVPLTTVTQTPVGSWPPGRPVAARDDRKGPGRASKNRTAGFPGCTQLNRRAYLNQCGKRLIRRRQLDIARRAFVPGQDEDCKKATAEKAGVRKEKRKDPT
jgi:hypothetical protein